MRSSTALSPMTVVRNARAARSASVEQGERYAPGGRIAQILQPGVYNVYVATTTTSRSIAAMEVSESGLQTRVSAMPSYLRYRVTQTNVTRPPTERQCLINCGVFDADYYFRLHVTEAAEAYNVASRLGQLIHDSTTYSRLYYGENLTLVQIEAVLLGLLLEEYGARKPWASASIRFERVGDLPAPNQPADPVTNPPPPPPPPPYPTTSHRNGLPASTESAEQRAERLEQERLESERRGQGAGLNSSLEEQRRALEAQDSADTRRVIGIGVAGVALLLIAGFAVVTVFKPDPSKQQRPRSR